MFELEESIKNWRLSLLQNQDVLESDAYELESHVRDEVDSLMLAGLTAEEAFMVSTHRIGDNHSVGQEYSKVNPSLAWRRRVFWMCFGILTSILISSVVAFLSSITAFLLIRFNINAYAFTVASALVHFGMYFVILLSVIFLLGVFTKFMKDKLSMSKVLVFCLISIFIFKIASIAFQVFRYRFLDAETIGKVAIASTFTGYGMAILWPIILALLLFLLWPSRPQQVR